MLAELLHTMAVSLRPKSGPILILSAAVVFSGCAGHNLPAPHPRTEPLDPQDALLIEKKVNDARYVRIEGYEHMQLNRQLLEKIEQYDKLKSLADKKHFVTTFMEEAAALNDRVIVTAVSRLTDKELQDFLAASYTTHNPYDNEVDFDVNVPGDTPQEKFVNGYRKHAGEEFRKELTTFLTLTTENDVDAYWQKMTTSIDESIMTKGRLMRLASTAPLVPFIYAWIWYHAETDDRAAHSPDFTERTVFYPTAAQPAIDPRQISSDWALLEYYAPLVIQEKAEQPPYEPAVDRFGSVWLEGSRETTITPHVDTEQPTLYGYADHKRIQNVVTTQLVYTFWYPEHPKLSRFDPEAGPMEGWTLRITLNQDNRPLLFESVSNCGCYYKVFPTERLEAWSQAEYPEKLAGKTFHLENRLPGKIDAIIPETVRLKDNPAQRQAVYYSAGRHQLITIRPSQEMSVADRKAPREHYQLLSYEELENLPLGKYKASLFDENGLVLNAHRPECSLLTPSGLFHAGHPRQRNTQMIYFDQAEFDDSHLLETYLRLPHQIVTRP